MSADPHSIGYLRWRCRRGMRELDVMLERFLEGRYRELSETDAARFRELLDQEDDQLWDWLSGRSAPQDAGMARLVEQLRRTD